MLARAKSVSVRLLRCGRGATAVEYGLIVALIALAAVTALGSTGTALSGVFTDVSDGMTAP